MVQPDPHGFPDKPDDLLVHLVENQLGSALLAFLIAGVLFVMAWIGFLHTALRLATRAVRRADVELRARPRLERVLLVSSTIALAVIEVAWVYVAFLIGNLLSFGFGVRDTPIIPLRAAGVAAPVGPVAFDTVSLIYVLFAIGMLVLAGGGETKLDDRVVFFGATIISAPTLLWGIPTAAVVLFDTASMLWKDGKQFLPPDIYEPATIAVFCLAYYITCCIAVFGVVLLVRLWHRQPQPGSRMKL
ncbi:hypothetical protein [Actinocrispum sp. NPDC049592]|uniref:hypothetical protein n=1 Tax=Actinocrispum sp. NPDC049592 TaxID=3154835 RepID=UPI0034451089